MRREPVRVLVLVVFSRIACVPSASVVLQVVLKSPLVSLGVLSSPQQFWGKNCSPYMLPLWVFVVPERSDANDGESLGTEGFSREASPPCLCVSVSVCQRWCRRSHVCMCALGDCLFYLWILLAEVFWYILYWGLESTPDVCSTVVCENFQAGVHFD